MSTEVEIARQQLARMRGMNAMYHRRFFSDIRFTGVVVLAMLVAGMAVDERLFLTIPFVALFGAVSTAFDASYLIFSRQFAARLERFVNRSCERPVLVAHELEDAYLFPLDRTKIVTMGFGSDFTWFGFMTAFYTVVGIVGYTTGLVLSLGVLADPDRRGLAFAYLTTLAVITIACLVVGGWWFVGGTGEERLRSVLDRHFPESPA